MHLMMHRNPYTTQNCSAIDQVAICYKHGKRDHFSAACQYSQIERETQRINTDLPQNESHLAPQ